MLINMRIEVLLSCMHQNDASIVQRTGIQSDALIINQCDHEGKECFDFRNKKGEICHIRMINTKDRGLSRSRNMALNNAVGDLCLICDDDEVLASDYVEKILEAAEQYKDYSIFAFALNYVRRRYSSKTFKIGLLKAASISSVQLVLRRDKFISAVRFNEKMGSGTGNGAGEENKFVVDCLKRGAKARYVPQIIATIKDSESQWMNGYNQHYWTNRGWSARMIYGWGLGFLYLLYTIFLRSWKVEHENSLGKKAWWLSRGFFSKR